MYVIIIYIFCKCKAKERKLLIKICANKIVIKMRDTGRKNYKKSKKIWITKNGHSSAETKFINENRK
jgi:hypothetical protein